ncbi:MAG: methyltransferase domain-containing protein [Rhodopila sp.]|nr:methyltransferase domain-containing protein [Rhodopila sp.]
MTHDTGPGPRLLALWDHLGLQAAHVATQMAGDIAGVARSAPERLGGVVLCVPARLDPAPFASVAARTMLIAGEFGLTATVTAQAEARLPGASRHVLTGYDAPGWADVVADRTGDILGILSSLPPLPAVHLPPGTGTHAGISYTIQGEGPPLVLLPFFLAPSQWEPAVPALAERFTVIVLGGRHLGGVAALEDRASGTSYRALARTLWDTMAIGPSDTVLDVGCGSGALDRLLAQRLTDGRIVATDLNRFLLREARPLAEAESLGDRIAFQEANAERLPFADGAFDAAFTVTVLEECDADQALRELYRVVKPGGRVGVIVRSIDLPQWWNLDLPPDLKRKVETPPQSVGSRGVADASLYPRMWQAGFHAVRCFPSLVTFDNPDGPIWRYREDHVLSQLSGAETAIWREATRAARESGLLFMANPMHCAVGTKPQGDVDAHAA